MPSKIVLARHALRLDNINKQWLFTSPTPYDSPLAAPRGFDDASQCGIEIGRELGSLPPKVYIHSSPFLRCVQTANQIAKVLASDTSVTIRLDAVLGEWLTEDYYLDISPPPADGHRSIAESSLFWLKATQSMSRSMSVGTVESLASPGRQHVSTISIDSMWDIHKFGPSGEYGEEWPIMHDRVCKGLKAILDFYEHVDGDFMVLVVTHGAVCNSLLGYLSNQPLLQKIGLSSFAIAERVSGENADDTKNQKNWRISFRSGSSPDSPSPSAIGSSSLISTSTGLISSSPAFTSISNSFKRQSPVSSNPNSPGPTTFRASPILLSSSRTPTHLSPTNSFLSVKDVLPSNTDPSVFSTGISLSKESPPFRFPGSGLSGSSNASPLSLSPSSSPKISGSPPGTSLYFQSSSTSKPRAKSPDPSSFMLSFGSS